MGIKIKGYKLSGYDATYKKTLFDVRQKNDTVLEVMDLETGATFILDFEGVNLSPKKTSGWRGQDAKGQGISITFGSRGLFEQLKYDGKKRKY